MTISLLLLFFFVTCAAGSLVFLFPDKKKISLSLLLSFSGAFLFSLTILDVIPDLYLKSQSYTTIGYCILGGFFVQLFLERFSIGVEHGHFHLDPNKKHSNLIPMGIFVSLCIHAFLEGVPILSMKHADHTHVNYGIFTGVLLHKIPESFAMISILYHRLVNKKIIIILLLLYALLTPLGTTIGSYLLQNGILSVTWYTYLMAMVSGVFIHVSTTIMFESEPNHKVNLIKMAVIMGGVLLAVGTVGLH